MTINKMKKLMKIINKWSDDTFDNGNHNNRRSLSVAYHLKKEIDELIESLEKSFDNKEQVNEEIVDCFMQLLDIATLYGLNSDELISKSYEKLEINKNRKWGKPDGNGVVEHIRK